jgi:dTDP-4-dehydrorhamnose reductase
MKRVLLLGSGGGLGRECEKALLSAGLSVACAPHSICDISDMDDVKSLFEGTSPDLAVNAAAYTNVDGAEDHRNDAFAVNAKGAGNIASECADRGIALIHISTDYVFASPLHAPHDEAEIPRAGCAYGESKLEGERLIARSGCRHFTIRTCGLFGSFRPGFPGAILRKLRQGGEVPVVASRICPTPSRALAEAVARIAASELSGKQAPDGNYHFAGAPDTTWYEFALAVAERARALGLCGDGASVRPADPSEIGRRAARPEDSRLSCARIQKVFGISQPSWKDYIDETLQSTMPG